ncbi:hypothetical protein [Methylomonas rivi]|uniref:Cytochrome c domain-containing protein n=1 Tax=Methylomonas rivi TaxID=2952226 RepID=A0ABT1U424_9GAMM|nr:hypothetical protein [Methylomonas sp. WSC-6]MCQ8128593.1 hypothetical protein [Methylomonas sp. WSC-6]
MRPAFIRLCPALAATILLTACAGQYPHEQDPTGYAPGLGEIMAQSAVRHAKLWFAGQARNWELAAYEVDELHEGFEDAAKYHPTHKHIKRPLPELVAQYMDRPLAGLEQAIKDKDIQAFTARYDNLTAACNACHQATDFGFNRVTQPSFNPFANQVFRGIELIFDLACVSRYGRIRQASGAWPILASINSRIF